MKSNTIKSQKCMIIYNVSKNGVKVTLKTITPDKQLKLGIKKLEQFINTYNQPAGRTLKRSRIRG